MKQAVKNGINFYRLGRLTLKYTNPFIIACIVAITALAYGFYKNNQLLRATNARLKETQAQLIEQAELESKAILKYQKQLAAQQQDKTQRKQVIQKIIKKNVVVKQSAEDKIAPVLAEGLKVLRGKENEKHSE
ncbi:MAG: hypothetical protein KGV56_00485 [Gammaproteobacteria bacterium]|nr:hypothetical protein [Gammaproteobacteria bacterium]